MKPKFIFLLKKRAIGQFKERNEASRLDQGQVIRAMIIKKLEETNAAPPGSDFFKHPNMLAAAGTDNQRLSPLK